MSQVRLRVQVSSCDWHEPVISRLISEHRLIVNIMGARLQKNSQEQGWFDLELRGTTQQIKSGLAYLESVQLKIVGKPNVEGDSWYY
ncbi:NIL domain-containing protein (plasmid) [Kovacikia minuta CCNUW1]|uniref:NIL domain-containing protein n=1 Tax=Kovacikia minuta TaxID=2931930 RepID=UPI001CCCC742|nr:NIL domain-containing protein [Kovacikia minuta]UBF30365.1 NIL domain-containing protein [Kovacikia minuta CCNUW1]